MNSLIFFKDRILNASLASLRMFCFLASVIGVYAAYKIVSGVFSADKYWRKTTFYFISRIFSAFSGMKTIVVGSPPSPPFVFVSNHLGYVDVAVLGNLLDTIFVAKSEVRNWFLVGKIIFDMGTVFVDREDRRDALRTQEFLIQRYRNGEGITFFPEGTSTCGEDVQKFKPSLLEFAAKNHLPVYYASISYESKTSKAKPSERVCWWDDTSFMKHLWNLFLLKGFTARIHFGKSAVVCSDRKELAKRLYNGVKLNFSPVD